MRWYFGVGGKHTSVWRDRMLFLSSWLNIDDAGALMFTGVQISISDIIRFTKAILWLTHLWIGCTLVPFVSVLDLLQCRLGNYFLSLKPNMARVISILANFSHCPCERVRPCWRCLRLLLPTILHNRASRTIGSQGRLNFWADSNTFRGFSVVIRSVITIFESNYIN